MVSNAELITLHESNRLLFETYETLDEDKNIVTEFGRRKTAKIEQAETNKHFADIAVDADVAALKNYAMAAEKSGTASADAAIQMQNMSDTAKRQAVALDMANTSYADAEKKIDAYGKAQKKINAEEANKSKGFGGITAGLKALAGNIGATLAVGLVLNLAIAGLKKVNEELKITKGARLEAMQTAITDYNDKISETTENTKNLKSIQGEFNTLAKGVDENGKNIGLSADEYDRYNELVSQIVETNPELIQSYTTEGNAIIDRNNAIAEGIALQKEYAQEALDTYSTNKSGNDIIEGAEVSMREARDDMAKYITKLGKDLGGIDKTGHMYGRSGHSTGAKESTELNEALDEQVDLENMSAEALQKVASRRGEILKYAKESGKYDDDQLEKINDDLITLKGYSDEYNTATQPIVDWLNAYTSKIDETTGKAIGADIPEALRESYQAGLREIATSGEDAGTMKAAAISLSESIANNYSKNVDGLKDIYKKADKAKEEFMDSNKDSTAVEKANNVLDDQANTLDNLAEKYKDTSSELAAFYQNEANNMRNFVTLNKATIEGAFNPFIDEIEEAQTASAELSKSLDETPDYYTALDNYKAAAEKVLDGIDNVGHGSQGFWKAAESIFSTSQLEEWGYDLDTVNAKMKELNTATSDGRKATDMLYTQMGKGADDVTKALKAAGEEYEFLDAEGKKHSAIEVADDGTISTFFDDDQMGIIAETLGYTEEYFAALLSSARQFANVDFTNVKELRTAIKDSEDTFTDKDGNMYRWVDDLKAEAKKAGYNPEQWENIILPNLKDMDGLKLFDMDMGAKEMAKQFIQMDDALGSFSETTGVYTLDAENLTATLHGMGKSADETTAILEKLDKSHKIDVQMDEGSDYETFKELVDGEYSSLDVALDVGSPEALQNATEQNTSALNALTLALGGLPTDLNLSGEGSNSKTISNDVNTLTNGKNWNKLTGQQQIDAIKKNLNLIEKERAYLNDIESKDTAGIYKDDIADARAMLDATEKTLNAKQKAAEQKLSSEEEAAANEKIRAAYEKYVNLRKEAEKYGDIDEEKFGNVDLSDSSKRKIEWDKQNLKKYKTQLDSWGMDFNAGDVSTVLGSSGEFGKNGEYKIAFSPVLATENGGELLNKNTVNKYIGDIVSEAESAAERNGTTVETEIMNLDSKGLEVDGKHIQGLIADIGDTADDTGKKMHYVGQDGALDLAKKDIASFIDEAGALDSLTDTEKTLVVDAVVDQAGGKDVNALAETVQNIPKEKRAEVVTFLKDNGLIDDTDTIWSKINKLDGTEATTKVNVDIDDAANIIAEYISTLNLTPAQIITLLNAITSGDIDGYLSKLGIAEDKKEIVTNAILNYQENGDAGAFKDALSGLDTDQEAVITAIVTGTPDAQALSSAISNCNSKEVSITSTTPGAGKVKTLDGWIKNINSKKVSITSTTPGAGNVSTLKTNWTAIQSKEVTLTVNTSGGLPELPHFAEGTPNRRVFNSAAKGRIGPNGKGGLTLTGELGPELVWLPSEGTSMMVGMLGPEMVNLPGDAVVYPADETRRIVGKTMILPRPKFGSNATGTVFGSASNTNNKPGSGGGSGGGSGSGSSSHSSGGSSSSKGKGKSKGKSKTDKYIDKYDTAKEILDHKLEMGYISEKTYYTKLKALYNKYSKWLKKKGSENRQALEDIHNAWIDRYEAARDKLDYQLEKGIISEATYYKKLKSLGKYYYTKDGKIRKGYLKEWREWQLDLNDARKDAYDAGVDNIDNLLARGYLTEAEYYKKLQELGAKYLEGVAGLKGDYNKHIEALNDARKDAYDAGKEDLDNQLEDELISREEYYKQLEALQDKWLWSKGLANDKEKEMSELKETYFDQLGKDFDDLQRLMDDKDLFASWGDGEDRVILLQQFLKQVEKAYKDGRIKANDYEDLVMDIMREIENASKNQFSEHKDSLDEIIDLIENMIRQEAEDYIKALEDQLDSYNKLVDKKKESLQLTEDELAYQDSMADSAREIAKVRSQIAALELDDSRSAKAKRAELQEQLDELLREQSRNQRDETISRTEDSLDKSSEKLEEIIQKQIDKINDWLDSKGDVLFEVYNQIDNKETNNLLQRLYDWNYDHGTGMDDTVTDFWEDMNNILTKYDGDIKTIVKILQKGADEGYYPDGTMPTIPTHHSGLQAGFTGDGADVKQHEVLRKLLDNELVLNREDQIRLASQLQILDNIKSSYGKLAKNATTSIVTNSTPIEIKVESNITIEGSASDDVLDKLENYGDKLADSTMDKLAETLRRNGVRTSATRNARKF